MLSIVFLLLTLTTSIIYSSREKIVGGINAIDGQYPYAIYKISLRYYDCLECGGSIISDKWVLTAAHCIYQNHINASTVHYGSTKSDNCQNITNGQIVKVKRAIINSKYMGVNGYYNDIALIEVEDPFEFNEYVQPIQLPLVDEEPPFYEDATLVGWGYQYVNGTVMEDLQAVNITIFPDTICAEIHPTFSNKSHICAGVPENGKGQCSGDSGGALQVNGIQYGVVSWSEKPCASSPGVLTRVPNFRQWIFDNSGV